MLLGTGLRNESNFIQLRAGFLDKGARLGYGVGVVVVCYNLQDPILVAKV